MSDAAIEKMQTQIDQLKVIHETKRIAARKAEADENKAFGEYMTAVQTYATYLQNKAIAQKNRETELGL